MPKAICLPRTLDRLRCGQVFSNFRCQVERIPLHDRRTLWESAFLRQSAACCSVAMRLDRKSAISGKGESADSEPG